MTFRLLAAPLLSVLALSGCSEYDLHRPDKDEEAPDTEPEPEPEPEPTEDPDIEVEPASIDFGSILKDCPSEPVIVTVTNKGLGDLLVSEITLGGDGSSAFSHTATAASDAPLTLAYGESATFEVTFTPTAWLTYDSAEVEILSNDPDEGDTDVGLAGEGAKGATYEEGFVQEYNELVDVLWIVDNSGSMGDELSFIGNNFHSFMDQFIALDLDYHIAVVTTDMDDPTDSGKFQGPVLTPDTPDVLGEFAAQVDQGAKGSGDEKGFEAAHTALSEPLLSTTNAGFLRDEASLSVIIVTDEDDSSVQSAAQFASWLQGLKPSDPTMARFNAFCDVSTEKIFGWAKYIDAVEATDGFYASIYSPDFSLALEEMSFAAAGMTVVFYLTEEPESLADMTVTVDGDTVPQDAETGWTYDPETNAVTFHGDSIPGPGANVQISYTLDATCE